MYHIGTFYSKLTFEYNDYLGNIFNPEDLKNVIQWMFHDLSS